MQTTVSRWGNSLAVRLPRHVTDVTRLKEGSAVDIEVRDEALVIRPTRKRFVLSELLAQCGGDCRRGETDWGNPVGEEAW